MKVTEQVKVLCVRRGVSEAELARLLGKSPQSLNSKMRRETFSVKDLEEIAEVLGVKFERHFVLEDGEKI